LSAGYIIVDVHFRLSVLNHFFCVLLQLTVTTVTRIDDSVSFLTSHLIFRELNRGTYS